MSKNLLRVLALALMLFGIYQYLQKPDGRPDPTRRPPTGTTETEPQGRPVPGHESGGEPRFGTEHPKNFDEAKAILRKLYTQGIEIYCGCPYDLDRKNRIDESACGYKGKGARSRRIEWEHVVPASAFGQRFHEWKNGHPSCERSGRKEKGRECARATSPVFAQMEADLYNLLPAIGELNAARSNYPFGEVGGEPRQFGRCDFEVGHRVVEPRPEVRGDLARIYFYMDARYPGFDIVNRKNEGLLAAWDREDPMDAAERARLQKIEAIQGNSFFIGRLSRLATVPQNEGSKASVNPPPAAAPHRASKTR